MILFAVPITSIQGRASAQPFTLVRSATIARTFGRLGFIGRGWPGCEGRRFRLRGGRHGWRGEGRLGRGGPGGPRRAGGWRRDRRGRRNRRRRRPRLRMCSTPPHQQRGEKGEKANAHDKSALYLSLTVMFHWVSVSFTWFTNSTRAAQSREPTVNTTSW